MPTPTRGGRVLGEGCQGTIWLHTLWFGRDGHHDDLLREILKPPDMCPLMATAVPLAIVNIWEQPGVHRQGMGEQCSLPTQRNMTQAAKRREC